jgi:serpin B
MGECGVKKSGPLVMVALAVFLVLWVGCGDKVCDPRGSPSGELSEAAKRLVESDNKFGLRLFREIVGAAPETNVFISPLSVSMALGMTYNGALGTTEEAMRDVLEYGDLTGEEINQSYRDIIDLLSALDPNVDFSIANSIWCREGLPFKEEFLAVNRSYFDAEVRTLDFSSPQAAGIMNGWVRDKTNGKIEEIVDDPIGDTTIMFLLNAIYFKGAWTYEFDPEETYDAVFHLPDGSTAPCRMMSKEDTLSYFETAEFQAVDLPYGDGDFSMVVMLPRWKKDVNELVGMMTPENWKVWIESFSDEHLSLYMPKFSLEYEIGLKDVLTTMGMGVAFDPALANLRGLIDPIDGNVWIDKVKHKTFVQVDEVGTEAAAVTSVVVVWESAQPSMIVNKPFVFAVRDRVSDTILFVGVVTGPFES